MKRNVAIWVVSGLAAALQVAVAGDITGTITLKGTPPKEKEITPLKDDVNCGKLHTEIPTTHFYVVCPGGELADAVVAIKGVSGKSTGASAEPVIIDQKGCEYTPAIMAVQTGQKILVKNSDPVMHNVHAKPVEHRGFHNGQLLHHVIDVDVPLADAQEFLEPGIGDGHDPAGTMA